MPKAFKHGLLWLRGFCSALPLLWKMKEEETVYGEVLSKQTYLYSYVPVLMKSYFDTLEFQHGFSVSCVADVPRSSEWPLQGNQASV